MQKRQWALILLALLIPLCLNASTLWQTIEPDTLSKILNGKYQPFGVPFNPWPEILKSVFVITALLSLLIMLAVFSSTKAPFQRHSETRRLITIVVSVLFLATLFGIGTYFIDATWSSAFHFSAAFGLPISPFAETNAILAFIATAMISFLAMWFSRRVDSAKV